MFIKINQLRYDNSGYDNLLYDVLYEKMDVFTIPRVGEGIFIGTNLIVYSIVHNYINKEVIINVMDYETHFRWTRNKR